MKRRQHHLFPAIANRLHHPRFHLAGGFFRKRQPQNVFAEQGIVRFQQVPDTLRDHARFPRPRARNHQQRPIPMRDRPPLRLIQLQPPTFRLPHLKQSFFHRWDISPEATLALNSADFLRGTVTAVHCPPSAAKCFAKNVICPM